MDRRVVLAVASAVAAWLEPVQTPDAAWAFNGVLKGLILRSETCSPFPLLLAPPLLSAQHDD